MSKNTIKDLTFDNKNANKHTQKGLGLLEKSLQRLGAGRSILLDKDNNIIAGNGVVEIAGQIGLENIRIIDSDGSEIIAVRRTDVTLDSKKGRELAIADNQTAKEGITFVYEVINNLAEEFHIDMEQDWGIVNYEEDRKEAKEDNYEPPKEIVTDIKRGDIYEFKKDGKTLHRLMCGDSTSKEDVELLMNGEKADCFITDPPYGVDYASKNRFLNAISFGHRIQEPIINDSKTSEEIAPIWGAVFSNANKQLNDVSSIYIFSPQSRDLMMMMMMIEKGEFYIGSVLVWVKNNHVLGRQDYQLKHEPIIYGWKKKGSHKFYGGFKTSVLEYDKPVSSRLHPTMKPVELIVELINNSTLKEGLLLDLFLGSGTTMVAAHQLNRRCYGMEIDEKYCQVIIDRMKTLDETIEIVKL